MGGQANINPGGLFMGLILEEGIGFPRTDWMTYSASPAPHALTTRWQMTVPVLNACITYNAFLLVDLSTAANQLLARLTLTPMGSAGVLLNPIVFMVQSNIVVPWSYTFPGFPITLPAGSIITAETANLDLAPRLIEVGIRHNFVPLV